MNVVRIPKDAWDEISSKAHLVVFNEAKRAGVERIDFALMVESKAEIPMQYATCRELDGESLYLQYGGSFPGTKGTVASVRCLEAILEWIKESGYKRVSFLVENCNQAMLKMAMRCGFLIVGVRCFAGHILVEHAREF